MGKKAIDNFRKSCYYYKRPCVSLFRYSKYKPTLYEKEFVFGTIRSTTFGGVAQMVRVLA